MKYLLPSLALFFPLHAQCAEPQKIFVEAESNLVKQSFNEARIPADKGTTFSIVDFNKNFNFAYRLYAGYSFNETHELRALYAPLTITGSSNINTDIYYKEKTFSKGTTLEAKYKFNSYRLTYRYTLLANSDYTFKIGFTGKIRDAAIELTDKNNKNFSTARTNLGFVPLLHANFLYNLPNITNLFQNTYFIADLDALAAPQGRAEDLSLLLALELNNNLTFKAGYRTVEGGAKNGGNVYTFAWLNYAVASILYTTAL